MNKKIGLLSLSALLTALIAKPAAAVCPVCTIAVASGVGFSRYLGIDDTITGLWIGGLTVSIIAWTIDWLKRKNIHFWGRNWLVIIAYAAIVIGPLYFYGMFNNDNCICGVNKLLLGLINGATGFWAGAEWYTYLKVRHNNRAYFPFQKVVMPIAPLIILSLIFYWLLK
ncbi:MAG TPA: hypothetical protein PLE47_01070 [bacterium]|jgi:hypothetical protein|nr:hypothetical protein [bacterium]